MIRLRRATRQEDGEPGRRFKTRKPLLMGTPAQPLLMGTGQIWQGGVRFRLRGRDCAVKPLFEGETDGFEGDTDGFETS
jgi:hypothetical protein